MMDKITNIIKKLTDFLANIDTYFSEATEEAEDTIIDMNITQLYDAGENRTGAKIKPEYSPVTVAIKKKKGQPTNRVTLRDTFEWQASFYVDYYPDGFEIKASDWKTEVLTRKYGEEILGLQDDMVKQLCDSFYAPYLSTTLKNLLNE